MPTPSEATATTPTTPATDGGSAAAVSATPDTSQSTPSSGVESPKFDWAAWDGEDASLPEPARQFSEGFRGYFSARSKEAEEELASLRSTYESLMMGREDPRVAEMQSKLSETERAAKEHSEKYSALQAEYEKFKSEIAARQQAEEEAWMSNYKAQNAWMFDDGPIQQTAGELIDEGFSPEELPLMLRQPAPVIVEARKINKELQSSGAKGVGKHALALARAKFADPERPLTAEVVAGSTGTRNPPISNEPDKSKMSTAEIVALNWRKAQASR